MRLNVGCGRDVRDGWVNVDCNQYDTWPLSFIDASLLRGDVPPANGVYLADVRSGLPFRAQSFDGAVANHVLQMVAWPDLVGWLDEVRRVLKPDTWLRLLVPDLVGAFGAYQGFDPGWFPISDEHERSIDGKLCMYLSQAGATRSVFTSAWLSELCARAGFDEVAVIPGPFTCGPDWMTALDSRMHESLIVEARR